MDAGANKCTLSLGARFPPSLEVSVVRSDLFFLFVVLSELLFGNVIMLSLVLLFNGSVCAHVHACATLGGKCHASYFS